MSFFARPVMVRPQNQLTSCAKNYIYDIATQMARSMQAAEKGRNLNTGPYRDPLKNMNFENLFGKTTKHRFRANFS